MKPTGKRRPVIYILGEAPGETEDAKGRQFIGKAGQFLRKHLKGSGLRGWSIRWNNTLRCRPPQNRTPVPNEIECCRPKQIADIERTKPYVLIVTGNVPLQWVIPGASRGITAWRGRLVFARIGTHACWVYPVIHPSAVIRQGGDEKDDVAMTTVFRTDLEWLAKWLRTQTASSNPKHWRRPQIIEVEDYAKGITTYTKCDEAEATKVIAALKEAAQCDLVAVDNETLRLRPYWPDSRILSAAIAFKRAGPEQIQTHAFCLHHPQGWRAKLRERVWAAYVEFLHAKNPTKVAHNAKYEQEWNGYFVARRVVTTKWACTQAQAYILDSRQGMLDLDVVNYLCNGFWLKALSGSIDKNRIVELPLPRLLMYNALDAKWLIPIYWRQQAQLAERPQHLELARERIETATTLVLAQLNGLLADKEALAELIAEFQRKRKKAEERAHQLPSFRRFFKLARKWPDESSRDDMQVLFTRITPCPGLMKNGKVSTAEERLVELSPKKYPEAKAILDLREPAKVLSTYLEPLVDKITPDGRVHTNFNPYDTDTERLSSNDPNIQNFPKRENRHVRKVIKAG